MSDLTDFEKKRLRGRKKFLRHFPKGFYDEKYIVWERDYKWQAHLQFEKVLNEKEFSKLLSAKKYIEIANRAVNIEIKTNLLFSFEKMALRDAVKTTNGAKPFVKGLFEYIYGRTDIQHRFENFAEMLSLLPRKQTCTHLAASNSIWFYSKPQGIYFFKTTCNTSRC